MKKKNDYLQKMMQTKFFGWLYVVYLTFHYKGRSKCKYYQFAKLAHRNNVKWFRIDRIASEFTDSWFNVTDMAKEEKNWYFNHGFNPTKKSFCGVSPNNYKIYLSDFEFYNSDNYINDQSGSTNWFDNKLNTYYLLKPFNTFLPKHYYYINAKSEILPLDVDEKHNYEAKDVLALLKVKALVAKKCLGGHGDGFYKFEFNNGHIFVNKKEMDEREFLDLVSKLKGYILTDFVRPSAFLRKIVGEDAFAVLRVMAIYDKQDGPIVERMMIRLGTQKSGYTQASNDYIYVGLNEKGEFSRPLYEYSDYKWGWIEAHPETGEAIEGIHLPNIELLKKTVKDISGYLPESPYLMLDIIPTDDSFAILEINSHGQPFNFEPFNPVKNSVYFTKLFKTNK